jgi:hypothetical protein
MMGRAQLIVDVGMNQATVHFISLHCCHNTNSHCIEMDCDTTLAIQ